MHLIHLDRLIQTLIRARCTFRVTCFPDIFVKRATVDGYIIYIYIYIPSECIELSSVGLRSSSPQLLKRKEPTSGVGENGYISSGPALEKSLVSLAPRAWDPALLFQLSVS